MNQELKLKLLEYMSKLEAAVQTSGDFVAEQVPLVVQEYVAYQRGTSTVVVVFGLIALLLAALSTWQLFKPKNWNGEFPIGIVFMISTVAGCVFGGITLANN